MHYWQMSGLSSVMLLQLLMLVSLAVTIVAAVRFFLIYRSVKIRGKRDDLADTQEALDALVASNMVNLGIILPLGMLLYTAVQ